MTVKWKTSKGVCVCVLCGFVWKSIITEREKIVEMEKLSTREQLRLISRAGFPAPSLSLSRVPMCVCVHFFFSPSLHPPRTSAARFVNEYRRAGGGGGGEALDECFILYIYN